MGKKLKENLSVLVSKHEQDSEIQITWNDEMNTYGATMKI